MQVTVTQATHLLSSFLVQSSLSKQDLSQETKGNDWQQQSVPRCSLLPMEIQKLISVRYMDILLS